MFLVVPACTQVRVAVIREEGSNGDREMAAAVYAAGMEPWDITMSDLINGRAQLDSFRGIIFVGGFSYADVLDSAKGWAATIRFNDRVLKQFQVGLFVFGVACNAALLTAAPAVLHLSFFLDRISLASIYNRTHSDSFGVVSAVGVCRSSTTAQTPSAWASATAAS